MAPNRLVTLDRRDVSVYTEAEPTERRIEDVALWPVIDEPNQTVPLYESGGDERSVATDNGQLFDALLLASTGIHDDPWAASTWQNILSYLFVESGFGPGAGERELVTTSDVAITGSSNSGQTAETTDAPASSGVSQPSFGVTLPDADEVDVIYAETTGPELDLGSFPIGSFSMTAFDSLLLLNEEPEGWPDCPILAPE
jgi:hypothetical protein